MNAAGRVLAERLGGRPIAVLLGGFSNEREVSLVSGGCVAEALTAAGHRVVRIDVGRSFSDRGQRELDGAGLAFVVLHGEFGEDGQVQSLLEEWGIAYTGSGPASSALAMDKNASKKRFISAGVSTPRWRVCGPDASAAEIARDLGLPLVVKPNASGSSIGVTIVRREKEITSAIAEAARQGGSVLAEEFIAGRELTVGILGREALPAVELITKRSFYDYEAKYADGAGTEYVCPAELDERVRREILAQGLAAHEALGCRHFSRVDLRLRGDDGKAAVLEVNTIPGFTSHSLLPKAAAAHGIAFGELCERIAVMAFEPSRSGR